MCSLWTCLQTFGALFTAKISSIFEPTSMTLPPFMIPEFLSVISSFAMPRMSNFCADCGTPHIRSKCAFNSNTVASYANVMSCLALLKTTVNSICSGISQMATSSAGSEQHAPLSAGASKCTFSPSTSPCALTSAPAFEPFNTVLGSRFSGESPFSEASK